MKKVLILIVLVLTPTMALAQGTVLFANNSSGLVRQWTSPTDATLISVPVGGARVELLAAPAGTALIPLINSPFGGVNFSTLASWLAANPGWAAIATTEIGPVAGIFNAGTATLWNVAPGTNAEYVIIGWTGSFPTFDAAIASGNSSFGSSSLLTTATGNPTSTPPGTAIALSYTFTGITLGGGWPDYYFGGFTTQPASQTVVLGGGATFYVAADAYPSPFYQWYFNGVSIPWAYGSSFQVSNAQLTNAGTYWVVLNNPAWGVRQSASATLTVLEPPNITHAPQDQTAYVGSTVSFQASATGTAPMAYKWLFNATNALSLGTSAVLTLTDVQPAQAGAYTVVVTNAVGAVTSAPALLSVIPSVERRTVPGLVLRGQPGSVLNLEDADALAPSPAWATLDSVVLTNTSQWYFDNATPLPPQRFYRAWQAGGPSAMPTLDSKLVPGLTLAGLVGGTVRVDYINQFGPTDAWVTLDTVSLSNTSQLYFDVTAPGQPPRLYRLVQVP
jgi:Immunoglobulin domain